MTNCTTATKQLQTLLTETQAELTNTKRSLVDYARKNEDLLVRITEQRLAQEKLEKVESLYFLHVSSFNAYAPFHFRFSFLIALLLLYVVVVYCLCPFHCSDVFVLCLLLFICSLFVVL